MAYRQAIFNGSSNFVKTARWTGKLIGESCLVSEKVYHWRSFSILVGSLFILFGHLFFLMLLPLCLETDFKHIHSDGTACLLWFAHFKGFNFFQWLYVCSLANLYLLHLTKVFEQYKMLVKPTTSKDNLLTVTILPSWELTYPHPRYVWRWFSFSNGEICYFPGGYYRAFPVPLEENTPSRVFL